MTFAVEPCARNPRCRREHGHGGRCRGQAGAVVTGVTRAWLLEQRRRASSGRPAEPPETVDRNSPEARVIECMLLEQQHADDRRLNPARAAAVKSRRQRERRARRDAHKDERLAERKARRAAKASTTNAAARRAAEAAFRREFLEGRDARMAADAARIAKEYS